MSGLTIYFVTASVIFNYFRSTPWVGEIIIILVRWTCFCEVAWHDGLSPHFDVDVVHNDCHCDCIGGGCVNDLFLMLTWIKRV